MTKKSFEQNPIKENSFSQTLKSMGENPQSTTKQEGIELISREELEVRLNEAEMELNVLKDQLLRTQAESQNLQKRNEKKIADAGKYALQDFSKELLGVIDNLERALAESSDAMGPLYEGVQRTHELFLKAFSKFGLQPVDPSGKIFDPALHEAISTAPAEGGVKDNQVIQVLQKGYLLNDRLIRPALVIVAKV